MKWTVVAPFITQPLERGWLSPFVPGNRHTFGFEPTPARKDWHKRDTRATGGEEWKLFWRHGSAGWKRDGDAGVITVFPQLAAVVGMRKRLSFGSRRPILAWSFNLGQLYRGVKGRLAKFALHRVNRFVCHSRREAVQYGQWLGLPTERFEFVPLPRGIHPIEHDEERDQPFIVAMGSAKRDYATFFEAVKRLKFRAIVVAASHAVAGLAVPENVEVKSGLSEKECLILSQRARLNVVPIDNTETASGQITVIDAMALGRPIIASRCMGTEDYIDDGRTGVLVEPKNVEQMTETIRRLWDDDATRAKLGETARAQALLQYSNEAVGRRLGEILDSIADSPAV
jgi:glycosyltransferase involved in cell wall biosynthesis